MISGEEEVSLNLKCAMGFKTSLEQVCGRTARKAAPQAAQVMSAHPSRTLNVRCRQILGTTMAVRQKGSGVAQLGEMSWKKYAITPRQIQVQMMSTTIGIHSMSILRPRPIYQRQNLQKNRSQGRQIRHQPPCRRHSICLRIRLRAPQMQTLLLHSSLQLQFLESRWQVASEPWFLLPPLHASRPQGIAMAHPLQRRHGVERRVLPHLGQPILAGQIIRKQLAARGWVALFKCQLALTFRHHRAQRQTSWREPPASTVPPAPAIVRHPVFRALQRPSTHLTSSSTQAQRRSVEILLTEAAERLAK